MRMSHEMASLAKQWLSRPEDLSSISVVCEQNGPHGFKCHQGVALFEKDQEV